MLNVLAQTTPARSLSAMKARYGSIAVLLLALVFELVEVLDQVGVVSALVFDVGEVAAVVFGGLWGSPLLVDIG